jgi:excinuclease UvrABC ATPase subunit
MGDRHITYSWKNSGGVWKHGGTYEGYIPELLDAYRKAKNPMRRKQLEKYMQIVHCRTCDGARLNPQARAVRITTSNPNWETLTAQIWQKFQPKRSSSPKRPKAPRSRPRTRSISATGARKRSLGLTEVCALSIAEAAEFFQALELDSDATIDRRRSPQGDPRAVGLPAAVWPELSDSGPHRPDFVRRRKPANSTGRTDWLRIGGGRLHSG